MRVARHLPHINLSEAVERTCRLLKCLEREDCPKNIYDFIKASYDMNENEAAELDRWLEGYSNG